MVSVGHPCALDVSEFDRWICRKSRGSATERESEIAAYRDKKSAAAGGNQSATVGIGYVVNSCYCQN